MSLSSQAIAENDMIAREVERLKSDLTTIHTTGSTANALAAAEVDNALSSVSWVLNWCTFSAGIAFRGFPFAASCLLHSFLLFSGGRAPTAPL